MNLINILIKALAFSGFNLLYFKVLINIFNYVSLCVIYTQVFYFYT